MSAVQGNCCASTCKYTNSIKMTKNNHHKIYVWGIIFYLKQNMFNFEHVTG